MNLVILKHLRSCPIMIERSVRKLFIVCKRSYAAVVEDALAAGRRVSVKDALDQLDTQGPEGHPNTTYAFLLRQCRAEKSLVDGKLVHDHIVSREHAINALLGNLLLQMYGKCGDLHKAWTVFDAMSQRTVISWSLMIAAYAQAGHWAEAFALYEKMRREGVEPNDFTISTVLSACSHLGRLAEAKVIHRWVIDNGYQSNVVVQNALVNVYAKCGSFEEARSLFDQMEERTAVSWNAMISAFAQNGHLRESLDFYQRMLAEGAEPTSITFAIVLGACASNAALEEGKEIDARVALCGFHPNTVVQNALVNMYAKCGSLEDARRIFDTMEQRTVVSWTAMISAYALHGHGHEAIDLYYKMQSQGVQPNAMTFTSVLNACSNVGALEEGEEIHSLVTARGDQPNTILKNALLNMYAKCGSLDDARRVFDQLQQRDVFSWTNMITACTEHGNGVEALSLFQSMNLEGIQSNSITLASVLSACSFSGALQVGKQIHERVNSSGFQQNVLVQTALIDMYAKCGRLEDSRSVFSDMQNRNLVSWTAMIAAYAQHGHGDEAVELFKEMNMEGMEADSTTFTCILTACSHAGLLEEGRQLFLAMAEDYGITPMANHYVRAVDIIGRAGRLQDAEELIENMPLQPDAMAWRTLLSACRIHNQVERGARAAEQVAKLDPGDITVYILLSNIYAATGRHADTAKVRKNMTGRGLKKLPGKSFIEIQNKVHEFVAGDTTHSRHEEIRSELEKLSKKMKEAGYVPNTKDVLHEVDEEEKEQMLCFHSEKLAIAFGLIATPEGSTLQIVKNLRVCSDCHAATKFISKIAGRRIIVRDTNRFHHFENGLCSCKDYW